MTVTCRSLPSSTTQACPQSPGGELGQSGRAGGGFGRMHTVGKCLHPQILDSHELSLLSLCVRREMPSGMLLKSSWR